VSDLDERGLDSAAVGAAISQQIMLIHTETYDTPVERALTHVLDDLVVVVLDIELSPIEKRMIELTALCSGPCHQGVRGWGTSGRGRRRCVRRVRRVLAGRRRVGR